MLKYIIRVIGLKLHKRIALCTNLGIQEAKIRSPNSREERNFGVLQKRCHDLPHIFDEILSAVVFLFKFKFVFTRILKSLLTKLVILPKNLKKYFWKLQEF